MTLGLPRQESWYSVSLAEKILNTQLNEPTDPDIRVFINSDVDWYFDANNPSLIGNRFDLASILLHEMYHGLGFQDGSNVNENNEGFMRLSDNPFIFGRFLEDSNGQPLIELQEGSAALGMALESPIFFGSESFQGGNLPRLFTPTPFNSGSSIAHLDEITYNLTLSALMTPLAGPGEVERDAGISDDMMYDMGWNYTSIVHFQPDPIENVNDPFTVEATIVSDNDVDESSLTLHYLEGRVGTAFSVPMIKGEDGIFRGDILPNGEEHFSLYYMSVNDMSGKTFTNPGEAPDKLLYRYDFAIDDIAPEIVHEPITDISTVDNSFDLLAEVTDQFIGVIKCRWSTVLIKEQSKPWT